MKNIIHVKVSSYQDCWGNGAKEVFLDDWLTSTEYKLLSEKIRKTVDEEQRKKLKLKLPCVTPSGLFSARCEDGLIVHSGLVCIDIDKKQNPGVKDFEKLKDLIRMVDCVAYCGVSTSGKGFFALIPISRTDLHKEHFESLAIDFLRCGIVIDSTSNVSWLRFYSYDPDPYINLKAKQYCKIHKPAKRSTESQHNPTENRRVEALINEIGDTLTDITGKYPQWFEIGCALANEYGEEGRDMFHRISVCSELYDTSETDNQFTSCLKKPTKGAAISINTLFHYAKLNGVILNDPANDFRDN